MNLYKITVEVVSPKGRHEAIEGYKVAANDEEVYEYIDKNINSHFWTEENDEGGEYEIYSSEMEVIGSESYRDHIIRNRGEQGVVDFSNTYYGVNIYGWELVEEGLTTAEACTLIYLKIAK